VLRVRQGDDEPPEASAAADGHARDEALSGRVYSIDREKSRRLAIKKITGFIGILSAIDKFFRYKFEENDSVCLNVI
jgi:hypothetical protein